jgi:hypothetical protein
VKPEPSEFLSGSDGDPGGGARLLARRLRDRVLDARARGAAERLDELAATAPERDVLVLAVYRRDGGLLPAAAAQLRDSRHRVRFALGAMEERAQALADITVAVGLNAGKFENLNALLHPRKGSDPVTGASQVGEVVTGSDPVKALGGLTPIPAGRGRAEAGAADWTLVVDDDVVLPDRFLDRLLGVAEHHDLALAQPAQSLASHAAWPVTRRRPGALLRETRFVEIGPVTLFRRDALEALTPFPPLRYGWGLDLHWAAVAEERGWRLGIVDALAVRHESGRVAGTYSSCEAIEEAREFLAERPFLDSDAAQETKRVHPLR